MQSFCYFENISKIFCITYFFPDLMKYFSLTQFFPVLMFLVLMFSRGTEM